MNDRLRYHCAVRLIFALMIVGGAAGEAAAEQGGSLRPLASPKDSTWRTILPTWPSRSLIPFASWESKG